MLRSPLIREDWKPYRLNQPVLKEIMELHRKKTPTPIIAKHLGLWPRTVKQTIKINQKKEKKRK